MSQDPFAEVVREVKIEATHLNNIKKIEQNKFDTKCREAARKMAEEMRIVGSPLHNIISYQIRQHNISESKYLTRDKIPHSMHQYFDILSTCYDRRPEHIINDEFNNISESVTIHIGKKYHQTYLTDKLKSKSALVIDVKQ